jgi:hypothetical protein
MKYNISEVWSLSLHAVREALGLIDQGSTPKQAAATVPGYIERRLRTASESGSALESAKRPTTQPRCQLGDWFYWWYRLDEYTQGTTVLDAVVLVPGRRVPTDATVYSEETPK